MRSAVPEAVWADAEVAYRTATPGQAMREAGAVLAKHGHVLTPAGVQAHMERRGIAAADGGTAVSGKDTPDLEQWRGVAERLLRERVALPAVPAQVLATRREEMGFDTPQEGVALFSDLHYYSRIDRRAANGLAEYNIDIARDRLARWRNGVLRFTQMSQLVVEVDTLHLFALGDDLEGHGHMFESQALQMSESIMFQVLGFVEDMTEAVLGLLARYKHVKIYKVPGNHGRVATRARGAYTPDNFETMAWQIIGERLRAATGGEWRTTENGVRVLEGGRIDLYVHTGFFAAVSVMGKLVLARHGHGLKGLRSTYTGAENSKHRMNAIIGQVINYYFKAHLHQAESSEGELEGEIIQNGCFVGPSLLSLEMAQATANLPSQEFMLFHPKYGKTHHYRIHLAAVNEVRRLEVIGR